MGGLLDKANAAKDSETEPKPVAVKAAAEPAPSTSTTSNAAGGPDSATKISLAGWVIILLGAILSLQGGAWGFIVVHSFSCSVSGPSSRPSACVVASTK